MIHAPNGVEEQGESPLPEQTEETEAAPWTGQKSVPFTPLPASKEEPTSTSCLPVALQEPQTSTASCPPPAAPLPEIMYTRFQDEAELSVLQRLIDLTLSEPYTIYTYRYFVYNWPELCFFARHEDRYVGVIVCKVDYDLGLFQGYIAMLAVDLEYRKQHIGRTLVVKAIEAMIVQDVDLVVLETECTNAAALSLYDSLGFIREQRLFKYYLNGGDAFRLKLGLKNVMESLDTDGNDDNEDGDDEY